MLRTYREADIHEGLETLQKKKKKVGSVPRIPVEERRGKERNRERFF